MTGAGKAKLARGGAVQDPGLQHTIFDERHALAGNALAVERPRAQAALAQRIVDDVDAGGENPLAHLVLEEARLTRDRAAVDGADQMADDRARDAPVEHHRHLPGRDLARI